MKIQTIRILPIALCAAVAALVLIPLLGYATRQRDCAFDGSALVVDGVRYTESYFFYDDVEYSIGRADGWTISPVKEDPNMDFLVARSLLDTRLYVREAYAVPASGSAGVVYVESGLTHRYTDPALCSLVQSLIDTPPAEPCFTIERDRLYAVASALYAGFESCPVGTELVGYIGWMQERWVYIPVPAEPTAMYVCYPIPEAHWGTLHALPCFEGAI